MSYCLNPNCQAPENTESTNLCLSCASKLLLKEQYRAIKPIGEGGFGRTFLAEDKSSGKRCVIKQFFPQQQSNIQKASELFRQEAQQLEQLGKHPQIPELFDYFEEERHQYLVQEYIPGENLATVLADEGNFDESQIYQLLNDLLPVLQVIHNHQVIHRDIKPENIIRRHGSNQLVLVDFGAAKLVTETRLAKTGTVIGSAAYTAPEQARGKAIFASDLYSLAVTCIHLLTQLPPFDLFDSTEGIWIWRDYLKTPISNELGQIIDKMLPSATKDRYQSAGEVLQYLNASPQEVFAYGKTPRKLFKKKWLFGSTLLLALAGTWYFTSFPKQSVEPQNISTQQSQPQIIANTPGLHAQSPDGKEQLLPLQHTEVMAKVAGNVARVEVTQTFTNPFNNPLEAVYVFPLPDEAAVDDMEIIVGDRIIRGTIKKRGEAKRIYQEAKQQGKTAALLEQEKDNIFTQSLANIKPGEKIQVTIRYTDSMKFEEGSYEFVFPTVVGERYISGEATNKQVNDTSRINPILGLFGGNKHGQDIGITVEIEAGLPISNIQSPSHQINATQEGRIVRVQLDKDDKIPDKDLILRYRVASNETQSTVLTQADERGGHFATYFIPALQYQTQEIVPKDVVFLIDTSGSQKGAPMEQSKELMRGFVNGLNPQDTFTVINFSNTNTQLSPTPLANTEVNRAKAIAYINRLQADGGTELMNGIRTVENFPAAKAGRLRSIVLITDGLIGNDEEIIAEVQKNLKPGNRLYSFGVGSSVNRFLIDRLAEVGQGIAEVISQNEPAKPVVDKFLQRLNNPVLTNIELTWEGTGRSPEIYPNRVPDLFANQPLVVFGKKLDGGSGILRVKGIAAGGKVYEQTFPINFNQGQGNPAIAQLWGRARIKELMYQMFRGETPEGIAAITNTALAYRLLSKYTAFIAVTEEVRVAPNSQPHAVKVPVKKPHGIGEEMSGGDVASAPEPSQVLAVLALGIYLILKRKNHR
ncbi:protein kinase domain-containing protein [Limnofasciculus baicalensis]|uniref:VIT domain-containing protein n=1 Tax=Limnofasciculus baicalensis BBK-W-15 TaxID=2699891 RepID=A0AAE3GSZ3_9CYAN|nr:VIT domain-containing protein [Limnofasciculus baicalensis]MCP2730180.1 VIT domain-containing protein [Limnofasciculus baicalensis BBK-W-15]